MRIIYVLFLSICLAAITFVVLNDKFAPPLEPTVTQFLETIKAGEVSSALLYFGDISCSCPPKEGYGAYLKYESGLEPNLAFLVGHNFQVGPLAKTELHEKFRYTFPWEKPTSFSVSVPLLFEAARYSPIFLPLSLAFGRNLELAEFQKFIDNPNLDCSRGLTLRLRPSLEPGLIKLPQAQGDGSPATAEANLYITPSDPGQVLTPGGDRIPHDELAKRLPKLRQVVLHLKLERRGSLTPWLISHFHLSDAIVQIEGLAPVRLRDEQIHN
jgi:hypothetical protein